MAKTKQKFKILAAGDFHGNPDVSKHLAQKAEKKNVDLVILLGDIHGVQESEGLIEPFIKAHKKVIFIPGNWDSTYDSNMIEALYDIKNIDGRYVTYNGIDIAGVGDPDFQLYLDEGNTFQQLKGNFKKMKSQKKILVSHLHARGTKSEFSGFRGSEALRRAIEEFQPDLFLHAHIHEAEGIEEKIGKTKVINVGRKGKIIEI